MAQHPHISIANAPVSYGAFEVTVGHNPNVPDGVALLDAVAGAGYDGIDLGPLGYLGRGDELGQRLEERGLGLAGAYLEFSFHDSDHVSSMMSELDAVLDTFDAVARYTGNTPTPRPTIADAGSDARRAAPGSGARDPGSGLTDAEWFEFALGMNRVVARCRERGYEPTLHCETGSFVESTAEIERAIHECDVDVCLETGHQTIGGGDVLAFARKWHSRINHVHLKDVHLAVIDDIVRAGSPTSEIWNQEAFPTLGNGDVPIGEIIDALINVDYRGWFVVEQDIFPTTAERFARAIADQRTNREFLAARGL